MAEMNPNPTAGVAEEKGEQVVFFNSSRHEHELCLFDGLSTYTCNGCNENGANIGYKCELNVSSFCKNFTLHEACATLPDVFQHPFRRHFKFRPKTHLRHHCGACRDVLRSLYSKGLIISCSIPVKLDSRHAHRQLKLVKGYLKGDAYSCSACDKNIEPGRWRYRCDSVTCNFCVDLSCAKIDFYGFSDSSSARVAATSGDGSCLKQHLSGNGSPLLSLLARTETQEQYWVTSFNRR